MKKELIIDNYDSFTYNLVHSIEATLGHAVTVKRNDELSVEAVDDFDYIVISPGPGIPDEAGITLDVIKTYYDKKKILGVCLGLQSIYEAFGGRLLNLNDVYHGMETEMYQTEVKSILFKDVPKTFSAGRYHSWIANKETLPEEIEITCVDDADEIMGIQLKGQDVYAVQFHPESIMTEHGDRMIANFLNV